MKKIVYIVSTLENRGPINVLFNSLKYLDRSYFEPIIITLSPENKKSRIKDFENLNVNIIQLNQSRIKGLFLSVWKIKNILKNIVPDCIQANCFRSNIIVGFFLRKYKTISIIHNYPYEDYIMKFGKFIGYIMHYSSKLAYNRYNLLVSVSEALKVKVNKKYGINSIAIKNGIDINHPSFKTVKTKNEIRKELNIATDKKVFIYLDSLIKRKDPETTIKGFIQAFNENNTLLVVGGGILFEDLKTKYKNTNIIFTDFTSEPYKYLQASDCFISSSLSESFHLSVVEAMFNGLYVILSDIDAHQEFISLDDSIGVTFKRNNINDLKDKLKKLNFDNFSYSKKHSPQLVIENLSAEIMSKKYQDIYINLANSSHE